MPEVEPKSAWATALASAKPQSVHLNAPLSNSTVRFAAVPLADRPIALGAEETKGVQKGGDQSSLTSAVALARFVAAAPVLRPVGKDRGAGRVVEQIGKTDRHVEGNGDTSNANVQRTQTQETAAAAPDICVHPDWRGQRAFLLCHAMKLGASALRPPSRRALGTELGQGIGREIGGLDSKASLQ